MDCNPGETHFACITEEGRLVIFCIDSGTRGCYILCVMCRSLFDQAEICIIHGGVLL